MPNPSFEPAAYVPPRAPSNQFSLDNTSNPPSPLPRINSASPASNPTVQLNRSPNPQSNPNIPVNPHLSDRRPNPQNIQNNLTDPFINTPFLNCSFLKKKLNNLLTRELKSLRFNCIGSRIVLTGQINSNSWKILKKNVNSLLKKVKVIEKDIHCSYKLVCIHFIL